MKIYRNLVALLSGVLFSIGLGISGMTQPDTVIGFLDVFQSIGAWDPSLLFVMISAVITYGLAYRLSLGRAQPYLDSACSCPQGAI